MTARVSPCLVVGFALTLAQPSAAAAADGARTPSEQALLARLSEAPQDNEARYEALRRLLEQAGCSPPELRSLPVQGSAQPSVECVLPGRLPAAIVVVGAHFDVVRGSRGVADNWSGACLLPSLYADLRREPRRHTFRIVGFSAEEVGLLGSKSYVSNMTAEEREGLRAMINLDTLGWGSAKFLEDDAAPELAAQLAAVAARLGVEPMGTTLRSGFADDSLPFREAGLPTITFHGLTPGKLRFIHTRRDRMAAIDEEAYLASYRLISAFVTSLDEFLAQEPN